MGSQAEEGDFTVSRFSQILSDSGPDLIWLKSTTREECVLALSIHGWAGPQLQSQTESICGGQSQGDLGLFQNLFSHTRLKDGVNGRRPDGRG